MRCSDMELELASQQETARGIVPRDVTRMRPNKAPIHGYKMGRFYAEDRGFVISFAFPDATQIIGVIWETRIKGRVVGWQAQPGDGNPFYARQGRIHKTDRLAVQALIRQYQDPDGWVVNVIE